MSKLYGLASRLKIQKELTMQLKSKDSILPEFLFTQKRSNWLDVAYSNVDGSLFKMEFIDLNGILQAENIIQ
jgi:hypothetical protein